MKYRIDRLTDNGVIDHNIEPGVPWQLESVRVHLSAGGSDNDLTITVDAGASAATEYNLLLASQNMNGVTDYLYQPQRPIPLNPDDGITIGYLNGNTRTIGIETYYSGI